MKACGIDPGLTGAVSIFDTVAGSLIIIDMPTATILRNGKQKAEVSAPLLASELRNHAIDVAMIERVNAMTKQGVSSVFSFGKSAGIVEGVLAGLMVPFNHVTPQAWQKAMGVRDGKDGSRQRAAELFPAYAHLFARKKDNGRSDAALIAYFLATR